MKNESRKVLILLLLLACSLVIASLSVSESRPGTTISVVNPETGDDSFRFYTNMTDVGDRFNATVWITEVADLYAYQIYMTANDERLNITNAWIPNWEDSWVFYEKSVVGVSPAFHDYDNDSHVEAVQMGEVLLKGEPTISGDGIAALIEFQVTQSPPQGGALTSVLNITVADTFLLDSALNDIPTQKANGNYQLYWSSLTEPWLEVTPTLIQYGPLPPSAIGQQFNIEVLIKGLARGWDLKSARFTINYNNTLIEMVDYEISSIWDEASSSVALPDTGVLLAIVNEPVDPASGDTQTVQIIFRVKYQDFYPKADSTQIALRNITLLSYSMQEIPTESPVNSRVIIRGLPASPWLEVAPEETEVREPYPLAIGKDFTVDIVMKSLNVTWKLSNTTFALTYNQTLVKALGITEGTFMSSYGATGFKSALTPGRIDVNQFYLSSPQLPPEGEGTIASVTFNITSQAPELHTLETVLQMENIILKDTHGNDIPSDPSRTLDGLCTIRSLRSSSISIVARPTSVTIGSEITVNGTITPTQDNVTVTIYGRTINQTWRVLGQVQTDSGGSYTYTWKADAAGDLQFKAQWPGDEITAGNESAAMQVMVESSAPPPDLTLYAVLGVAVIGALIFAVYYFMIRKPK